MGRLPCGSTGMDALEYDYLQFQRLVTLNTQK